MTRPKSRSVSFRDKPVYILPGEGSVDPPSPRRTNLSDVFEDGSQSLLTPSSRYQRKDERITAAMELESQKPIWKPNKGEEEYAESVLALTHSSMPHEEEEKDHQHRRRGTESHMVMKNSHHQTIEKTQDIEKIHPCNQENHRYKSLHSYPRHHFVNQPRKKAFIPLMTLRLVKSNSTNSTTEEGSSVLPQDRLQLNLKHIPPFDDHPYHDVTKKQVSIPSENQQQFIKEELSNIPQNLVANLSKFFEQQSKDKPKPFLMLVKKLPPPQPSLTPPPPLPPPPPEPSSWRNVGKLSTSQLEAFDDFDEADGEGPSLLSPEATPPVPIQSESYYDSCSSSSCSSSSRSSSSRSSSSRSSSSRSSSSRSSSSRSSSSRSSSSCSSSSRSRSTRLLLPTKHVSKTFEDLFQDSVISSAIHTPRVNQRHRINPPPATTTQLRDNDDRDTVAIIFRVQPSTHELMMKKAAQIPFGLIIKVNKPEPWAIPLPRPRSLTIAPTARSNMDH